MSYFSQYPLQFYDATGTGKNYVLTTDITKKVGFRTKSLSNATYFEVYTIKEGETPESIAFDMYGDATYHWVILLTNNILDRFHDWPMPLNQLLNFVDKKYTNVNGVHHYEINKTSGDTTKKISIGTDNTDYPDATLITNFEYEQNRQDDLRKIKIVKEIYIQQVIEEFRIIMGNISNG